MSIVYDSDGSLIKHSDKSIDELKRESYHHKSIENETMEVLDTYSVNIFDDNLTLSLFDTFVKSLGKKSEIIKDEINIIRDFLVNTL